MGDALKLSIPTGTDPKGNSALGIKTEDSIARGLQLTEDQKRIKQLEKNIADLEQLNAEQAKQASQKTSSGKSRHVAHVKDWKAICTEPDLCKVGKDIVAFDSFATLDKQHKASPNVKAQATPVYRKGDMLKGVQADAGKHITSGTSQGGGHVKILDGHNNVKVNGIPIARHDSNCMINCDASGNGGAKGKLVTEQKSVSASATPAAKASNPEAPPGQRSSEKLERLKDAKSKLEAGQLNLNALDEYVNFKDSNNQLDGLIGQIQGTPGSATDYAAQATRGVLGFVKDGVMGIGELAYEGIKAVPKIGRSLYTSTGQALGQLDGQILAENIKLGNITAGTIGQGALDIGKAIVKPVTDPWAKGQYVEAGTRAVTEIGTLAFGWIKGSKAAQAAKAAEALKLEEAAKAAKIAEAAKADELAIAAKSADGVAGHVDDGVHVKKAPKRARPDPNGFDGPEGYKTHGKQGNPLDSPEGKQLVDQYKAQGMTEDKAIVKAQELMESGTNLPKAIELAPGDTLYKVVPEGNMPGKYSAYFGTEQEINSLKGMSYDQISDRLGIPLESQQTLRFDVVKVTANQPTTVFESVIARTTQNGYAQPGGGVQTLITNRSIFTDPVITGIKLP